MCERSVKGASRPLGSGLLTLFVHLLPDIDRNISPDIREISAVISLEERRRRVSEKGLQWAAVPVGWGGQSHLGWIHGVPRGLGNSSLPIVQIAVGRPAKSGELLKAFSESSITFIMKKEGHDFRTRP